MSNVSLFRKKMETAGVCEPAIKGFERAYNLLSNGTSFDIPESDLNPATEIPDYAEIEAVQPNHDLLSETVVIKLNGGLGTGMGLQKAKSLLEVKEQKTFLDLIVKQIRSLREETGNEVRFLLMNSFSTSKDTLKALAPYEEFAQAESVEMMQNQSPKILQDSLLPAESAENPQLDWCPPGHGDLYTALQGSGWLDKLLDQGVKYAFVSNSDNLGAVLDEQLLTYFAKTDAPFLMEVTRRTSADSKGGHLAVRKEDNQLLLREVAQCPDEDLNDFQNIDKHQFFNTNNLWVRLDSLKKVMEEQGGILPLPVITNKKTLNPRDGDSPPVYQLEIAMGAAIECFKGAQAVCVPRTRFAPVKTTADLLNLRSDAYEIHDDGRVMLKEERNGKPPLVKLSKNFKFVDQMESLGVPSLIKANSFKVDGNIQLESEVVIEGDVSIENEGEETFIVESETYKNQNLSSPSQVSV